MLHMDERVGSGNKARCARAAPTLLAHLSLLFVLYSGALLATCARLAWDPSLYVPLRALAPGEYRAACALLPAAALLLLAPAPLAVCARAARPRSQLLLYLVYASLMLVALVAEVWAGAWAALRVRAWLRSADARRLRGQTLLLRDHVLGLLAALDHPLPQHIKALMKEAEEDLPWNGYVACACAGLLLAAQLASLALALAASRAAAAAARSSRSRGQTHRAFRYSYSCNGVGRPQQALLEPGLKSR